MWRNSPGEIQTLQSLETGTLLNEEAEERQYTHEAVSLTPAPQASFTVGSHYQCLCRTEKYNMLAGTRNKNIRPPRVVQTHSLHRPRPTHSPASEPQDPAAWYRAPLVVPSDLGLYLRSSRSASS